MFLPLFNSTSMEHLSERTWVLNMLADGLKDQTDFYLYKKYHVFELATAFYNSPISDKNAKVCFITSLI